MSKIGYTVYENKTVVTNRFLTFDIVRTKT